jgi:hypothetical protein
VSGSRSSEATGRRALPRSSEHSAKRPGCTPAKPPHARLVARQSRVPRRSKRCASSTVTLPATSLAAGRSRRSSSRATIEWLPPVAGLARQRRPRAASTSTGRGRSDRSVRVSGNRPPGAISRQPHEQDGFRRSEAVWVEQDEAIGRTPVFILPRSDPPDRLRRVRLRNDPKSDESRH